MLLNDPHFEDYEDFDDLPEGVYLYINGRLTKIVVCHIVPLNDKISSVENIHGNKWTQTQCET